MEGIYFLLFGIAIEIGASIAFSQEGDQLGSLNLLACLFTVIERVRLVLILQRDGRIFSCPVWRYGFGGSEGRAL